MDLEALKTEIDTDPESYGYAVHVASGSHAAIAAALNVARASIAINRGRIPAWEVVNAIVPAERATLTPDQRDDLDFLIRPGLVDAGDPNVAQLIQQTFIVGATSRANLAALATRDGSRAEQLFGAGVRVSSVQVAEALRI